MKTRLFASVVALGICVTTAYADFAQSDWQFYSPINIVATTEPGGYVKLDIPRGVSMHARPDLSDLRIIPGNGMAGGGGEVPYQLVIENESVRQEYVQSSMRDLSASDGETMFILDLGSNGTIHDHLLVNTSSKNFKRPVQVYAADTALHHGDSGWRLLSDKNYIYNFYDQALGFDAGSRHAYYPESTSRYLRVVIGRGEGGDVSVSGANVLRILERDAKKNQLFEHASLIENAKEKSTELTVDLLGTGVATRKITLLTDDTNNFSRRVVIQGSNDATSWNMLGQGYVFFLKTPLFSGSEFSVTYPESRTRYIRIVVFNEDNQPVHWKDTVSLEGVARSLVFAPQPGFATHLLYYGNKSAAAPRYDIARFFQYFEGAMLPEATLGAEVANSAYVPPAAPVVPFTERNKDMLNVALIVLVAVVTFMLIAYLKKLKIERPHQ